MNLFVRSSRTKRRKRASATAIVYSVILLLSSCRIPCLREPEPGPNLPETFNGRASEENSAELAVPEFFNDPTLTCLIEEALAGNQQLKILAEDIQIANNEVLSRRGAYLPFFNLGLDARTWKPSLYTPQGAVENQLQPVPGKNFPNPLPNFLVATDVSWQIDIWRKLRNARDAAGLRFLGTTEGRNYVVTRLVADVAENYYTLMALDKRLENLDTIIKLQEQSLGAAKKFFAAARITDLPVQRFTAEVRKNVSEKLIIQQEIIETENRINFLLGRYPRPIERNSSSFYDLTINTLQLGVPSDLLLNRPDIREAERELAAAGLDIKVARANFFPALNITGRVGLEAFDTRYLFFTPESLVGGVAGSLIGPVINRAAIKAEYMNANARQLQAVINYQKTTLNAFTEVINHISMVENYSKSIEIKKKQLEALEASVAAADKLFFNVRIEYLDVLIAQRDLMDARMVLITTKRQQLAAIVNTYQALGGGATGLNPNISSGAAQILPEAFAPSPDENVVIPPEPTLETSMEPDAVPDAELAPAPDPEPITEPAQ